jgi:type IV pilus assembly protein PilE
MKNNAGFTLIELMIVVAIIGVLAMVALPNYNDYITRSRITEAVSRLSDAKVRMEQYFQDNRYYSTDGVAATTTCGLTVPPSTYFSFSCAVSNSGQAYVWTATGTGSMAGFSYTINQQNAMSSAIASGAVWPAMTQSACWITNKSGC